MRRQRSRKPYVGNGITPSQVLLDCNMFHIYNIFDAAYVSYSVCQLLSKVTFGAVTKAIAGSLKYGMRQRQKGEGFPPESEWTLEA